MMFTKYKIKRKKSIYPNFPEYILYEKVWLFPFYRWERSCCYDKPEDAIVDIGEFDFKHRTKKEYV